ncbi:MAG: hypothetical protein JNL57_04200 [Bacteroidetes bacterium]|nr:hypothetical protein [Bacteroidota bacterium]
MSSRLKTGGRKAGTPNKTTAEVREMLSAVVCAELDSLQDTLSTMSPAERLNIVIRLIPYVLPKPLQKFESEQEPALQIQIKRAAPLETNLPGRLAEMLKPRLKQ